MLKVLKNLKNSFWAVVAIVILLCVQAKTDLTLPDYTSKIVNTGIQAGGIEVAVPEFISKENMEQILMFSEDSDEISNSYTLLGDTLNEKEQKTLALHYMEGLKMEQVGRVIGVSQPRASQIHTIALRKLRHFIETKNGKGIKSDVSGIL